MPYVGYTGVANQANTSDGFALNVTAANVVGATPGDDVGDNGVVDLYGGAARVKSYILMESSGYVLQEDSSKIELESN
jgi:hypothetical protein